MGEYGQRRQGAKLNARHKGRSDEQPVSKAVHAVADQHRPYAGLRALAFVTMVVMVVVCIMVGVLMPVVPELSVVQHKKQHKAGQQDQANDSGLHSGGQGLGQKVQTGGR